MSSILDNNKQPVVQNPAHYKQRILSGILILLVLCVFLALRIWVNSYIFDLLIGALMIVSAYEVDNLLHKMDRPTYFIGYGVYPVLVFISVLLCLLLGLDFLTYVLINLGVIVVLGLCMAFLPLLAQKNVTAQRIKDGYKYSNLSYCVKKSLNTCFVCVWPVLLFSFAFAINHFDTFVLTSSPFWLNDSAVNGVDIGVLGLVLLFVTTMLADTCAMLFGRLLKTRKISMEKLGPGKSWGGFFAGIIGAGLAGMLTYAVFTLFANYSSLFGLLNLNVWYFLLIGLVCGLFNMLGDTFSSYFKRRAVVKDFSNLIPGHGGVMDRINGLVVNSFCVFAILLVLFA